MGTDSGGGTEGKAPCWNDAALRGRRPRPLSEPRPVIDGEDWMRFSKNTLRVLYWLVMLQLLPY